MSLQPKPLPAPLLVAEVHLRQTVDTSVVPIGARQVTLHVLSERPADVSPEYPEELLSKIEGVNRDVRHHLGLTAPPPLSTRGPGLRSHESPGDRSGQVAGAEDPEPLSKRVSRSSPAVIVPAPCNPREESILLEVVRTKESEAADGSKKINGTGITLRFS